MPRASRPSISTRLKTWGDSDWRSRSPQAMPARAGSSISAETRAVAPQPVQDEAACPGPCASAMPAPSASVDTVKHRPMACISACRPSASDCKKATAGTTNTPVSAVIPPVNRPHNRPSQA